MTVARHTSEETVRIDTAMGSMYGTLMAPERMWAGVILAHGSGSSRNTPRNIFIAESLNELGFATLLVDLLTPAEERIDSFTAQHRFNIPLLTERIMAASDWFSSEYAANHFSIGYFGASTGAAAALAAAAARPEIPAVVSRGGRPDLAGDSLTRVQAATLLMVGGLDRPVIDLNRAAYERLESAYRREIAIVPDATHLFEEHGALERVGQLTGQWFVRYLGADSSRKGSYQTPRGTHQTHSMN